MKQLTAVEFFSGIGAFAYAARRHDIQVIAAFDQSEEANYVYHHNFELKPSARNLDTISGSSIPQADMWWLSPPCEPYTIRGKQRDELDTRARSLARLIELLPKCLPNLVLLENVRSFAASNMHQSLRAVLNEHQYNISEYELCPTSFGVPMKRPRFFLAAHRGERATQASPLQQGENIMRATQAAPLRSTKRPLAEFLSAHATEETFMDHATSDKYSDGLNIIDPKDPDAVCITFTSGYAKSMKASGSLLQLADGRVRRFSPQEMLSLFGFSSDFTLPAQLPVRTAWRLIGNSVEINCIEHLLSG